jgi:hypothetical protein
MMEKIVTYIAKLEERKAILDSSIKNYMDNFTSEYTEIIKEKMTKRNLLDTIIFELKVECGTYGER